VLQGIDVATGQMFRDIGMPEIADYDAWPLQELEKSGAAGLLWVVSRGHPLVPAACLTADSSAGSGSQPSCDQMILPDALTRANQG
jgi:hypothetical protein